MPWWFCARIHQQERRQECRRCTQECVRHWRPAGSAAAADNHHVADSALQWFIHEVRELLSAASEPDPVETAPFERLAVPHTFQPRLTWGGAAIAVIMGIVRMVLASLLFAVWGTCIWMVWAAIHNWILRSVIVVPLVAGFCVTLLLLMVGISVCEARVRTVANRRY